MTVLLCGMGTIKVPSVDVSTRFASALVEGIFSVVGPETLSVCSRVTWAREDEMLAVTVDAMFAVTLTSLAAASSLVAAMTPGALCEGASPALPCHFCWPFLSLGCPDRFQLPDWAAAAIAWAAPTTLLALVAAAFVAIGKGVQVKEKKFCTSAETHLSKTILEKAKRVSSSLTSTRGSSRRMAGCTCSYWPHCCRLMRSRFIPTSLSMVRTSRPQQLQQAIVERRR